MPADKDAREQLLKLLDRKAFDPVLKASVDDYRSENDQQKLRKAQEKTRSTQKRYHQNYKSAQEVRDNFKADLSSDAAKKVHDDLRDLGLPTINDIKGEFEELADRLDVGD